MLGYRLIRIHPSNHGFDYESDATLLLSITTGCVLGTVFFDLRDSNLIPVRAEYEDPETGVIKAVTL